jgi:hypothetical protein
MFCSEVDVDRRYSLIKALVKTQEKKRYPTEQQKNHAYANQIQTRLRKTAYIKTNAINVLSKESVRKATCQDEK